MSSLEEILDIRAMHEEKRDSRLRTVDMDGNTESTLDTMRACWAGMSLKSLL